MRTILNIIWILLGGWMAIGWFFCAVLCVLSIVGIPWARSCFVIGKFALWPFGLEAVDREQHFGAKDLGTGLLGQIGNLIWFIFCGWWLALGHIAAALMNLVSIIGIPFAWQHLKLAHISLFPIGKTIVES